jgi:hypothetical protein
MGWRGRFRRTETTAYQYSSHPDCPHRMILAVPIGVNALNLECARPADRCGLKSPDGRGLLWVRSGGSPLAYGRCTPTRERCPNIQEFLTIRAEARKEAGLDYCRADLERRDEEMKA